MLMTFWQSAKLSVYTCKTCTSLEVSYFIRPSWQFGLLLKTLKTKTKANICKRTSCFQVQHKTWKCLLLFAFFRAVSLHKSSCKLQQTPLKKKFVDVLKRHLFDPFYILRAFFMLLLWHFGNKKQTCQHAEKFSDFILSC